jgi:hypothetical protein
MLPEQISRLIAEHAEQTAIMASCGAHKRADLHRRTVDALTEILASWTPRRMAGAERGWNYQEVPSRVRTGT